MSAGKNRQQDQNSFSSAVITKSAGLSFLEALFIGLTSYGPDWRRLGSSCPKDPSDKNFDHYGKWGGNSPMASFCLFIKTNQHTFG